MKIKNVPKSKNVEDKTKERGVNRGMKTDKGTSIQNKNTGKRNRNKNLTIIKKSRG